MKPFRTSTSARILSGGAAGALIGAGLIPVLGLDTTRTVPLVILWTIAAGMAGLFVGAYEHLRPTLFGAMLLPIVMWAFTLGMLAVIQLFPSYGWALIAAGGAPLALFVASFGTRPEAEAAPSAETRHA
jgi:hypothetical protein